MTDFKPPAQINRTPVEQVPNSAMKFRDEVLVTLIPADEEDDRIWEFSLTTGKLYLTKGY